MKNGIQEAAEILTAEIVKIHRNYSHLRHMNALIRQLDLIDTELYRIAANFDTIVEGEEAGET